MIVAFPVVDDSGLSSRLSGHFGSAPMILLVDTDTSGCRALSNAHSHDEHGRCRPLERLAGERVDALCVVGIGGGALTRLGEAGIPVHRAEGATVAEALAALRAGTAPRMLPHMACAGHGHSHHHPH